MSVARLAAALRFVLGARWRWRWPARSSVLVYDGAGRRFLLDCLKPWQPEVLYCRGEEVNVPVLLASLFGKGKRRDAYLDAYIRRVGPRLVVTCIDNDPAFYRIGPRHPGLKTMFLQNGYRGYYLDVFEHLAKHPASRSSHRVDYMLVFGPHIGTEYARHIAGAVLPAGSVANNGAPKVRAPTAGALVFISQYQRHAVRFGNQTFSHEEFCREPDHAIVGFLRRYASDHGKTLRVVTRSLPGKELELEQAYFRELAGASVGFASGDGYGAVDDAEVVVCNTSTLGLEAAARGCKTAFFAIHKAIYAKRDPRLVWDRGLVWPERFPDDGPFWTYRNDPLAFKRILDHLFAISGDDWRRELEQARYTDVIAYDKGNSVFFSLLRKELGATPGAAPSA
jgi:surface carbohydrate biosynthesis protein